MRCRWSISGRPVAFSVITLTVFCLAGCDTGPKTHPVSGTVVFEDGDISQLAGNFVEVQHESDENLRGSGEIQPDGSFTLGILHDGKPIKGVLEGTYKVRITLLEEGDQAGSKGQPRSSIVNPRFLDYSKSKLTLKVPTEGEYKIQVSKK